MFIFRRINATSDHKPGGGNVRIFHEKPKFNVTSKIGSLDNAKHVPGIVNPCVYLYYCLLSIKVVVR